jgi:hypothetical protein
VAGSLTRYRWDRLGERLEAICAAIGVVVLVGTVAFALVTRWAVLSKIEWEAWLVSLLLAPVGTLYGLLPAHLCGFGPRQART